MQAFKYHQCMKSTFHNSHVILDLVLNTGIFWIELSCGGENWSKKMIKILILDWSHRSQNHLRSSSGSGWPPGNIHIKITLNLFLFTYNVLFPLSSTTLYRAWLYIWVTRRVYLKNENYLPFAGTWAHRLVLVGFFVVHLSSPTGFGWVFLRNLFSFLCCVIFLCIACLRPVSCVPNVAIFPGLSILDCLFGFL